MAHLVGTDWLSANARRNYPLSQEATAVDVGSSYKLPDDFIVDMQLNVPWFADADPTKFYIHTVSLFSQGVVVSIGYDGDIVATSQAIPSSGFTRNSSFLVQGQDQFANINGVITISTLDHVLNPPPGIIRFTEEGGRLESTVVNFGLLGVTSIRVKTGNDISGPLTGNVIIRTGKNSELVADEQDNCLTISALEGAGFQADPTCGGILPNLPPIKTINNVSPDASGNIFLISSAGCLDISGDVGSSSIIFDDTCSNPCCGCEELKIIIDDVKQTRDDLATLIQMANRLEGHLLGLSHSFFGSIINAGSCLP